jgi:hypothetical protein
MAIPVQFQQFKAAGIYRVVYDKSTVLGTEAELLRLVVGYSPKGPFNTPVYIKSATDFIAMFGNISKTLEKRGCFFHRTAIQALEAGPILCLNLKKFDTETVGVANISDTIETTTVPVRNIFDTSRFWKLEPNNLDSIKVTGQDGSENVYLHISSIDSKETSNSFLIRKPADSKVKAYDITVSEWYNTYGQEVPEYLMDDSLADVRIKDFFTEVYVFSGKFDGVQNSSLKDYFEAYTVPASGNDVYEIEDLYVASSNSDYVAQRYYVKADIDETTKIEDNSGYAKGNKDAYANVGIPAENAVWFESKDDAYYIAEEDRDENGDPILYTTFQHPELNTPESGKYMVTTTVTAEDGSTSEVTFEVFPYYDEEYNAAGFRQFVKYTAYTEAELQAYYPSYSTVVRNDDGTINEGLSVVAYPEWKKTETKIRVKETVENAFGDQIDALDALYNEQGSGALGHYIGCMLPNFMDPNSGYKAIDILFNLDSDVHHMMMSLNDNLIENAGTVNGVILSANEDVVEPLSFALMNTVNNLVPTYLPGYDFVTYAKPSTNSVADKLAWQSAILDVLKEEKGLREGLLSAAETDYRYIVDSFESFGTTNINYQLKSQLSLIAKQKELCFAILNFPSVSSLCKVPEQRFTSNGIFNINKVVNNIVLPSENNGASFCAFYTPLKFSDGYVDTIVPSAGLVSNLFMAKYNGRAAYSIIAGPNYANVQYPQLVGPDYNYSQSELQVIEPFGVNCMIYRPTFGTFVNANQTAKQTPKTALSAINVRELVIYLQDAIGKVLQSYQWEFNNPVTREAIKSKADLICETAKRDGGIQAYLNVMDESNNTPEIIDNEMCVLSTSIEPGRGAGKMIHELTIYRTGGMSSSITEA